MFTPGLFLDVRCYCPIPTAMKYLLLYEHKQRLVQRGFDDWTLRTEASRIGDELLRMSGRLLTGAQLQAADTVATLSHQHDHVIVTAGPLAEITAQLNAFYLIEAHDLNAALQMVVQLPQVQYSSIDVRPIAE